jgi:hypothetical protein
LRAGDRLVSAPLPLVPAGAAPVVGDPAVAVEVSGAPS